MRKRIRHSKRIQKLEKAAQDIRLGGNWNIRPHANQIVLMGDGMPFVYLKPHRGLFWHEVTESQIPFSNLLKKGQTVSLPDIIKVINYVERNSIK